MALILLEEFQKVLRKRNSNKSFLPKYCILIKKPCYAISSVNNKSFIRLNALTRGFDAKLAGAYNS